MMRLSHSLVLAGILTLGSGGLASADLLSLYLEAPSVQSTYITGATTETFNAPGTTAGTYTSTYSSVIGNYLFTATDKGVVQAADQFGGASGSQYMVFGSQSGSAGPITINLTASANYFGIWVSAADANNGISFYNGSTLVAHITTATIISLLNGGTGNVTAVNGTTYATSGYYGNPNNLTQDSGEPFTYLDIIDATGTFNKIVLDNSGTTGTGFESDNHSVYFGSTGVAPNATSVFVETVPEPSEYMAMVMVLLLCLIFGQRFLKARRFAF